MKLENIFTETVNQQHKYTGGLTLNYEAVKIKGLKNSGSLKELLTHLTITC